MRREMRAFWLGVAISSAVFIFTSGTTVDIDASAGEPHAIAVTGRVDHGVLGRLFSPPSEALGAIRVTKRGWGLVTTYSEQITVLGARLANAAGVPLNLKISVVLPGTVTDSNAPAREGRALVWTTLPAEAPTLWAQSRAVNWPVALLLAAAIAVTFWVREG